MDEKEKVEIKVDCSDVVNRFNTVLIKGLKVRESPDWLKNRLKSYGIESKNNIVDITNYVMVEFGQTLHAQDISKLRKKEIHIRRAENGEELTTLLGEKVKLDDKTFVLTQSGVPTVIGGIVGGESTAVDENTTEIVLDSGNYDQNSIRSSSRSLKIQNESVLRNDKFLHPALCEIALRRAIKLILETAGGEVYENYDYYPKKNDFKQKEMTLTKNRLDLLSGIDFDFDLAKDILKRLNYDPINESGEKILIGIPYFRTDVVVEDDLVADILRINDYNTLPTKMLESVPPKEITPCIYDFENGLRDLCASIGMHEHITDPIREGEGSGGEVILENALSSEKNALRLSIKQNLEEVANVYQKHKIKDAALFEIGKTYHLNGKKDDFESYSEKRVLEVLVLSEKIDTKKAKQYLASMLLELGISDYKLKKKKESTNIYIGDDPVGEIYIDGFNLNTEILVKNVGLSGRVSSEIVTTTTENISIVAKKDLEMGEIVDGLIGLDEKILDVYVLEETSGEGLGVGENNKSVLLEIGYSTSDTKNIREKILDFIAQTPNIKHRE